MAQPNQRLYEERIEKGGLTIVDTAKNAYIFNGKKYVLINFKSMTVREAINYLVCLYNILGAVDTEHQAEFEVDPVVDHLLDVAYKTYKNGKSNSEKWDEISPGQKNIARVCIDPFLEMLGMRDDPNSVELSRRLVGSEQNLKAALDNNDFDLVEPEKIPDLANQLVEANERYSIKYPNSIKNN